MRIALFLIILLGVVSLWTDYSETMTRTAESLELWHRRWGAIQWLEMRSLGSGVDADESVTVAPLGLLANVALTALGMFVMERLAQRFAQPTQRHT